MIHYYKRSYQDYVKSGKHLRSTDIDPRAIIIDKLIERFGLVVVESFNDDPNSKPGYSRDTIHVMTPEELARKQNNS